MSKSISRILLSVVMFPLAGIFDLVAVVILESTSARAIFVAGALTSVFVFAYWLLLWRSEVRWTNRRILESALATLIAIGGGVVVGLTCARFWSEYENAVLYGTITAPLLWVSLTIRIWRDDDDERRVRITTRGEDPLICPHCDYNLAGLREARCPECGASFTLNELFAMQAHRSMREIET